MRKEQLDRTPEDSRDLLRRPALWTTDAVLEPPNGAAINVGQARELRGAEVVDRAERAQR